MGLEDGEGFPQTRTMQRGRKRSDGLRAIRLKHIRCAYRRYIEGRSIAWLKRWYRVSSRTVQLWARAALSYQDPEAEALRRLVSRSSGSVLRESA